MASMEGVCIVTGGNRGIGAYITREFYRRGYRVIIGARKDSGIAEELGEDARFLAMDVRNPADHRAIVETAHQTWGRLDVYVNNAGFSEWKALEEVTESFCSKMIDTNLKGVLWGCQAAAARMGAGGAIVNISSLAGKRGSTNNAVYCASKFAVNGITQALAKELGPKGIRVNAVCPVYVTTAGLNEALKETESPSGGGDIGTYLKEFARTNAALGRLPAGEEIARFCAFLASPDASATTGQCINVDCGVLPQ